jgi:hypothetical protein
VFSEVDLVTSGDVFFAATGITDGMLLPGVHYTSAGATTDTIVMRGKTGTVRKIHAEHRWDKLSICTRNWFSPGFDDPVHQSFRCRGAGRPILKNFTYQHHWQVGKNRLTVDQLHPDHQKLGRTHNCTTVWLRFSLHGVTSPGVVIHWSRHKRTDIRSRLAAVRQHLEPTHPCA